MTNVARGSGGASACLPCPLSNGKCVTCPSGQYISETVSNLFENKQGDGRLKGLFSELILPTVNLF